MGFRVVFTPEALTQLEAIEDYIARHAGDRVAGDLVDAIVERCSRLDLFPQRGVPRDDIRPGLRVLGFRDSVNIAFQIGESTVNIIGVFYGGRDFEVLLHK